MSQPALGNTDSSKPSRKSYPLIGWILAVAGLLIAFAALLIAYVPYSREGGRSKATQELRILEGPTPAENVAVEGPTGPPLLAVRGRVSVPGAWIGKRLSVIDQGSGIVLYTWVLSDALGELVDVQIPDRAAMQTNRIDGKDAGS